MATQVQRARNAVRITIDQKSDNPVGEAARIMGENPAGTYFIDFTPVKPGRCQSLEPILSQLNGHMAYLGLPEKCVADAERAVHPYGGRCFVGAKPAFQHWVRTHYPN